MPPTSPFPPSSSTPGTGHIHLALQPPNHPAFKTLAFSYPLKLVVSSAHKLPPAPPPSTPRQPTSDQANHENEDVEKHDNAIGRPSEVPLLFLLTYGGGLLAGDTISLALTLDPGTRLTIATQGSTKVFRSPSSTSPSPSPFPSPSPTASSTQTLTAHLSPHSALWLAPDPVQPFKDSHFAQAQTFHIPSSSPPSSSAASLGVLDWLTCGRAARGEIWALGSYASRSEIYLSPPSPPLHPDAAKRRLLVRDVIKLGGKPQDAQRQNAGAGIGPQAAMHHLAIYGTLLLTGPVFAALARFFETEFAALPRIGGREWGGDGGSTASKVQGSGGGRQHTYAHASRREQWRKNRWEMERKREVLWTVATVRGGVTVVKFGAREAEGGREWLGEMLKEEGSVGREFGAGGLMCVR